MNNIKLLDWDSHFFKRKIGRVVHKRIDRVLWDAINAEARDLGIECLYFLVDISCSSTQDVVREHRLLWVDTRLEYTRNEITSLNQNPHIRLATFDDLLALTPLARTSHLDSRFFFDPNFPQETCEDFFQVWLKNSFCGFADAVFVFDDGKISGYMTLHRHDEIGQIGIIAVDPAARGHGIGRSLMDAAHTQYSQWGLSTANVVTQLRNIQAQRLYQANGYRITSAYHWYHYWL